MYLYNKNQNVLKKNYPLLLLDLNCKGYNKSELTTKAFQ